MASLSIEIERAGAASAGAVGLVAELDFVGAPTRSDRGSPRKVAVPGVGGKVVDGLAPGTWEVRLLMPTGMVMSREVELEEATLSPVKFELSAGPAGSTSAAGSPLRRRRGAPPTKSLESAVIPGAPNRRRRGTFNFSTKGATQSGAAPAGLALALFEAVDPGAPIDAVVRWRRFWIMLGGGDLDQCLSARHVPGGLMRELGSASPVWRLNHYPTRRCYVLGRAGDERRVACLPAPWRTHGDPSSVRIDGDSAEGGLAGLFDIVVDDPAYSGLLAYLAAGSVVTAVDLLNADDELERYSGGGAVAALRDKMASPLGACAAGYALLGSSVPGTKEPWHAWIGNLARWFRDIPDGAILHARLMLMQAATDEQAAEALGWIREALTRGLPFYRLGIDWLLQAMLHFADDAFVQEMRPLVVEVASALDMDEVFTTIRLDGERS